jgi:hypothetical protein
VATQPAPPSLAALEARWPAILDGLGGSLLDKMFLSQVIPTGLDAGVVALGGGVDPLELQRREASCRRIMESALAQEFGFEIKVRFAATSSPRQPEPTDADASSLAQYAESLFGGRLVAESIETDSNTPGVDHEGLNVGGIV